MHDVEDEPILWLREFASGLMIMVSLQVLCGFITLFAIRSSLSHAQKIVFTLSSIAVVSVLSSQVFDPNTHIIGSIIGGVSLAFTAPLQAVAWIERASSTREYLSAKIIVLRVAIPAAVPSKRRPAERPRDQFIRGIIFITIGAIARGYFEQSIRIGGFPQDAMALLFMFSSANGSFNMMAAALGLLGIYSPSPFRRPVLAPTMASFWGGRWNAPVSDSLRTGVYEPLQRRGVNPAAASMACFLCSAVAHEIILLYCGIRTSHGEWFAFFILCGIATIAEKAFSSYLPKIGFKRWAICFVILYTLFHYLFVPITIRTGLAHAGIRAMGTGGVLLQYAWEFLSSGV